VTLMQDADVAERLTPEAARGIVLHLAAPVALDPAERSITVDLDIANGSAWPIAPTGAFPVRIACFLVPAGEAGPFHGDFERVPLTREIAPSGRLRQSIEVPITRDITRSRLIVTLVQENNFWFHLAPIDNFLSIDLADAGHRQWWMGDEQASIVFGSVPEMNQARFRGVFAHDGKARPLFLHLETVNICNLRCVICPYVAMERDKETMPMTLFERVLDDYVAMGGGDVGLTPSVGDVFLDKLLVERVRSIRRRPGLRSIGFVTNAGNAGVVSDGDLGFVVNECARVNISVYGLDEDENAAMTRRAGKFDQIQEQIRRIVSLNRSATIVFAFRLLKEDAEARARAWMDGVFGRLFPYEVLTSFGNWGGAIRTDQALPFQGRWADPDAVGVKGTGKPCAYPALHLKVAVNGDVKFCSCIDYDSTPENIIGNIRQETLSEIYNGERARALWERGLSICNGCTHYKPIDVFSKHFDLLKDPIVNLGI
jgi:MoaA/NifB/PqqE/SkfB family radical SAM enzyme